MESYQTIITDDGSPTLVDPRSGQAMHAREGALAETLHLYGGAYKKSREVGAPPEIMVVGLGLGYIELSILAMWITGFATHPSPIIHSYEADLDLKNSFTQWLAGKQNGNLDQVLKLISQQFGLLERDLKDVALNLFACFQWQIHGVLNRDTTISKKFGLICYDPFSSSANPELWSEEWLNYLLDRWTAEKSVFSTYAANGRLKRSLRQNGFIWENCARFKMKRESTLATRS